MSVTALHHVHLKVRDLPRSHAFAKDFGLADAGERDGRIFMRGAGSSAYTLVFEASADSTLGAVAFEVDEKADLDRAVERFGARRLGALDGPGGGTGIELTDPEGTPILLVHGVAKREPDPLPPSMIFNQGSSDLPRRGTWQQKASLGPPPLLRLGHIGLFICDWKACDAWYREVLGLIASDLLYAGDPDHVIGGFYRLDRGSEWVDHHSVAFFQMGKSELHHLSFEVQNQEAQFMAHRWMAQRQHESIWGVGRHPLGSHVFDVWRDPSGYRFETFSDTDVLTADMPTERHSVADATMDLWSDRNVDAYFA